MLVSQCNALCMRTCGDETFAVMFLFQERLTPFSTTCILAQLILVLLQAETSQWLHMYVTLPCRNVHFGKTWARGNENWAAHQVLAYLQGLKIYYSWYAYLSVVCYELCKLFWLPFPAHSNCDFFLPLPVVDWLDVMANGTGKWCQN